MERWTSLALAACVASLWGCGGNSTNAADADIGEPDGAISEPDGAIGEPDGAVVQPDATPAEPDGAVGEPDATPAEPDATPAKPDAASPDAAPIDPLAACATLDTAIATLYSKCLGVPADEIPYLLGTLDCPGIGRSTEVSSRPARRP